jgi:hypothetical protein
MSKKKVALEIPAPLFVKIEWLVSYLFRTDLWTPLVKAAFVAVDDIRHDHSGNGKDQDADEDFVGLERGASDCDHESNARGSGVEFAYHDTDERASHG